jgi:hypothetical protein
MPIQALVSTSRGAIAYPHTIRTLQNHTKPFRLHPFARFSTSGMRPLPFEGEANIETKPSRSGLTENQCLLCFPTSCASVSWCTWHPPSLPLPTFPFPPLPFRSVVNLVVPPPSQPNLQRGSHHNLTTNFHFELRVIIHTFSQPIQLVVGVINKRYIFQPSHQTLQYCEVGERTPHQLLLEGHPSVLQRDRIQIDDSLSTRPANPRSSSQPSTSTTTSLSPPCNLKVRLLIRRH